MFNSLVESVPANAKKPWALAISAALQFISLGVVLLIPLLHTQALPQAPLPQFVVVPLTSRATARSMGHAIAPRTYGPSFFRGSVPQQPVSYAHHEEAMWEQAPFVGDPEFAGGVFLGPGDSPFIAAPPALIAPLSPAVQPPTRRIPVGGVIENAKLIVRVQPVYPALAVLARIEGTVVLHAIIAQDGSVGELQASPANRC